jgi:hypothetical protein
MKPDPGRLREAKLPCEPLLREYLRRTEVADDDGGRAWQRLGERMQGRPAAGSLARTRAALLGGVAVAVLGLWLSGRGAGGTDGVGGSEGRSGSAPGTGGMSGADPRAIGGSAGQRTDDPVGRFAPG